MKKTTAKKLGNLINILVLVIFLSFVFYFYQNNLTQYTVHKNSPNIIMDEETVQDNLMKVYQKSVLNPEHTPSWLQEISFKTVNFLAMAPFSANIVTYIHSKQDWVNDCSECALDGSCDDLEKEQYFYPLSINYDTLEEIQNRYQEVFIIDVRTTDKWEKEHIPSSVTVPLTDVVPYLFPMNRWHEIVLVGDNYLETKLAGEALIQLNFHRVYRLIQSVNQYPGELDTIYENE
jgi:rhodanese-related sulfurtransferase